MEETEKELLQNIKTFMQSAELVYQAKDYTSAATLYFKTLFIALDLLIFRKIKLTPKDHSGRFKILQLHFPSEYVLLDKYYAVYRSTYSMTISKKICEEVRDYVAKKLKEHFGI